MAYPTACTSAFCGNVLCDGCSTRPTLVKYHKRVGDLAQYEARQAQLRNEKATSTGLFAPTMKAP